MLLSKKKKIEKTIAFVILCTFWITIHALVYESKNIPMLATMVSSPLLLLIFFPKIRRDENLLYALLIMLIVFPLRHIESLRLETIFYGCFFLLTFILFKRLVYDEGMGKTAFYKFNKKLIYLYSVILVIQQISTLFGIPVFNKIYAFKNLFKLNSLAYEPSYLAGSMLVLMYSFLKMWEICNSQKYNFKTNFAKHKYIWLCFFYVCLTSGSAHCVLALFLILCYLFKEILKKNPILLILPSLAIISLFFFFSSVEAFARIFRLVPAVLTLDTEVISSVDLSAAARINPILFYLKDIDPFSLDFWAGYGIDYSKTNTIVRLMGYDIENMGNATGGLFPAFFYDYGMIPGLTFLCIMRKYALKSFVSFPMFIWLFCFISLGFNTYMQWIFFFNMTACKFFEKKGDV